MEERAATAMRRYLLSAFQIHQAARSTKAHGTSALKNTNTSNSTRAVTAERFGRGGQ